MHPILILDYGSQFTQLIARTVREAGAYCEIHPHNKSAAAVRDLQPAGIVLSGGPQSALSADAPRIDAAVFESGKPLLGVCYGMQAMALALGGEVRAAKSREYGSAQVSKKAPCKLLADMPPEWTAWMSHGDTVVRPPDGFAVTAQSATDSITAFADEQRRWYGLQFHPEVAHTEGGRGIVGRFVRDICGVESEWTMPNFLRQAADDIRTQTGDDGILLALSGGVDSAVLAALVHRAAGARLHCVLVDHGLMREGEVAEICKVFGGRFHADVKVVRAADKFFAALKGIADPEEKRRCIGRLFIEEFESQAKQLGGKVKWLAQGTIYPDVVESAGVADGGKAVIKSHHNVGGLPARLNLRLLEPLRELFKDEVRRLGRELELPESLLSRHPFPGPGLAVRVLGEVTAERVDIARQVDAVFMRAMRREGLYEKTAQAFAVLLPVRTVGVMGDARTYDNVVALRAVTTDDFMTADWARLPHDFLAAVSAEIINRVPGVNRVVYDISSKPPATVEWE